MQASARSIKRLAISLTIAIVVTVVLVTAFWTIGSHEAQQQVPLPAAETIGPGVGINVTYDDDETPVSCTAGFVVHTKDGQPAMLSAGHCNRPGGLGSVAVHHGPRFAYRTIGTFKESIYSGEEWNSYDIGLIALDHIGKIPLTSQIDGHPVVGVADRVDVGDEICHLGVGSGEPVCGPVVFSSGNKLRFTAAGKCGDSGGPVYRIRSDGAAEAVGVYIAVTNGDYSERQCYEPHEYSVTQLIKPWLRSWELTLATDETLA